MTTRREEGLTFWIVGQGGKTAEQSWHHELNADACHCSRFWLRAESLRNHSAHACTSFPLVEEADIKMLTRSMRFPHDPPAGNSRRGEVDDGERCEEEGNRELLQSSHFYRLGCCERGRSSEAPLAQEKQHLLWPSPRRCRRECRRTAPIDLCCAWLGGEEREGNTFDFQPSVNKLIFLEPSLWMAAVVNKGGKVLLLFVALGQRREGRPQFSSSDLHANSHLMLGFCTHAKQEDLFGSTIWSNGILIFFKGQLF